MNPYYDSLGAFLHMNGYGAYVWTCYALVFGSIVFLMWYARHERKSTLTKLKRQSHQSKLTNKQRKHLHSVGDL